MHGFPCSSMGLCFGSPSDVNTDPAPDQEPNSQNSIKIKTNHELLEADPVTSQPEAPPANLQEHDQPQKAVSCIAATKGKMYDTNTITISYLQDPGVDLHSESPSPSHSLSHSSEDDELEMNCVLEQLKYPQIPRPSIIIRKLKEPEFQETASSGSDDRETEDGGLSGKSVMAEPDYLEGDCDELIKPKKLINPVKNSRNHQDLHRELLMNQKRGLAPQNKPELQKVLEKRKREQVLKAQKEEQEAHKKRSDLEIELMKRQQKLEQLELEQQKNEEEQENTPEFVKMKSNLRRTKQEADGEEQAT